MFRTSVAEKNCLVLMGKPKHISIGYISLHTLAARNMKELVLLQSQWTLRGKRGLEFFLSVSRYKPDSSFRFRMRRKVPSHATDVHIFNISDALAP